MHTDIDCPYCGKGQEICHDDGCYGIEEDRMHEQKCIHCERMFGFTTQHSLSYRAYCYNSEHDWGDFLDSEGDPYIGWQECTRCKTQRLT
jgi:hypothetical protein